MRRNNTDRFLYWLSADSMPATKLIIITYLATFLAIALFKLDVIIEFAGFNAITAISRPWTFFTYPLVGAGSMLAPMGMLSLILTIVWTWWVSGSLERSWGTRTFTLFFFGMSAITAIGIFIGSIIFNIAYPLVGIWLPLSGLTIAYAMINPEQQILFMLFLPLKLKYLALLDVVFVLINYSQPNIFMGMFALLGCAFSYWYVKRGRSFGYRSNRRDDRAKVIRLHNRPSIFARLNPFRWYTKRREDKKFRDFLDKSGFGE